MLFILCDVSSSGLGPRERLRFARFLSGHVLVRDLEIPAEDIGPDEGLDELANAPPSDDGMQSVVDALVHGDGLFLLHSSLPQYVFLHVLWRRSRLAANRRRSGESLGPNQSIVKPLCAAER
jgi:hypothetical protein